MAELREKVNWFSQQMEQVLKENDHKRGIGAEKLFDGLVREIFELDRERHNGNTAFLH